MILDHVLKVVYRPDDVLGPDERVGKIDDPHDVRVPERVVEVGHVALQPDDVFSLLVFSPEHTLPHLEVLLDRLVPVLAGNAFEPQLLHAVRWAGARVCRSLLDEPPRVPVDYLDVGRDVLLVVPRYSQPCVSVPEALVVRLLHLLWVGVLEPQPELP